MKKQKKSGPALFMDVVIGVMAVAAAVSFLLYYTDVLPHDLLLWCGIVSFMIVYHLELRLLFGHLTSRLSISPEAAWFRPRGFEKKLYRLLKVKQWKGKALTYDPAAFAVGERSLQEIARTMAKSELDHWINELISLSSLLFALIWGQFWIFLLTALAAMLFDAQFILIQRYNRPRVMRLMERQKEKEEKLFS